MATAQATLNNLRQSPQKTRLVADLMRGKKASEALAGLPFVDKKAAKPLAKLLQSALANAKNLDLDADKLVIKAITVDGGATLSRRRSAARGRAFPIRKRTSKITLVLEEKQAKKAKAAKAEAKTEDAPKAEAKKPAAKKRTPAKKAATK